MSILGAIAHDKSVIPYRKELNKITGGITSSVLLQQIIYWHQISGGKFYKFIQPCNHALYRAGDSWTEELGLSRKEVITAMARLEDAGIVSRNTDGQRVTWHKLNADKLSELLGELYSTSTPETLNPKRDLASNLNTEKDSLNPKRDLLNPKRDLLLYTETNTETTADNKILVADAPADAPIAPTLLTTPPSKPKKSTITAKDLCIEFGVDEQIAQDWLTVRKAKKSPLTITALKTVIREAQKAGITLSAAIECSAEAGWVGFKAEWYENRVLSSLQNAKNSPTRANNGYTSSQASISRLNDTSWAN